MCELNSELNLDFHITVHLSQLYIDLKEWQVIFCQIL